MRLKPRINGQPKGVTHKWAKRSAGVKHGEIIVYHHTSTLRTNQLWMSGYIKPEGQQPPVEHPQLGLLGSNVTFRRNMQDFPPLVWFTRRLDIPNCLVLPAIHFVNEKTGETIEVKIDREIGHGIALNRVALGFPASAIQVVPWPEHYGYKTNEGRELNESARERFGDNPNEWWCPSSQSIS